MKHTILPMLGLPVIYFIAFLPGVAGLSVYQLSGSRGVAETAAQIAALAVQAWVIGILVGTLRSRWLVGRWTREAVSHAIRTGIGYGLGYGLGVAVFAVSLLASMATWGYPIGLRDYGSGTAYLLPVAVPLAGFFASLLDATLGGKDLGLSTWRLKLLWALTGLVGFSIALVVGDIWRGLPIGVMFGMTMAMMARVGVSPFRRVGVPG